jgi:hypothetical protein
MAEAQDRLWPVAFALFVVAWSALSLPWLSGAVTIPWDAKAHFYPQLQLLAQSLHRGESPFWTPFVFSGSPQVADPQSLIFSPPFLVLAWFDSDPGFQAFDAVVLGTLGVGGLFVMLVFRDRNWHPAGALVAALAFAFGAAAAWRVQHVGQILSLGTWPVALWLLLRALERRSGVYGLLAGLAAGAMALGRDQVAYLGVVLLAGAVVDHWFSGRGFWRSVPPLLAGAVGGALVVTVPVLLTLLLAESSNRPAIDFAGAGKGSLHPALLLTSVVPNLFGADGPFMDYWGPPSPRWGPVDLYLARNMGVLYFGALPLAALTLGFTRGLFWAREARFFAIAFVAVLLYGLGRYTPAFWLLFQLPGAEFFRRPADAAFFIGVLGALLAGYAVHRVVSEKPGASPRWGLAETLLLLATFAAAIALALLKETFQLATSPIAKAALCWGAGLAALFLLPRIAARKAVAAVVLAGILVPGDLAWNNGPNESTALPPATYDVLRPGTANETIAALKGKLGPGALDRVELAGLGFHWPNASLVHGLHHTLGYNPVRLGLYSRATGAEDHVALPDQRKFAPLFPSYRSTLADLLGLRFIATGAPIEAIDPALKPGDLPLLQRTQDGFLYENRTAVPRLVFATGVRPANFEEMLRTGAWPALDYRSTVLIEGATAREAAGAGSVTGVRYRHAAIEAEVVAEAPGYLVLHDPYHPWWAAEVDGEEVPILRANVIFRAVQIPAGRHRVRLAFRPFSGAWKEVQERAKGLRPRWP